VVHEFGGNVFDPASSNNLIVRNLCLFIFTNTGLQINLEGPAITSAALINIAGASQRMQKPIVIFADDFLGQGAPGSVAPLSLQVGTGIFNQDGVNPHSYQVISTVIWEIWTTKEPKLSRF
jgi:hypothetical protein